MTTRPENRHCADCAAVLSRYNPDPRCAGCQKTRSILTSAPHFPDAFWNHPHMQQAFTSQHMGKVCRAYRTHPHHSKPLSQNRIASWFNLTQARISNIETGPPLQNLTTLTY